MNKILSIINEVMMINSNNQSNDWIIEMHGYGKTYNNAQMFIMKTKGNV